MEKIGKRQFNNLLKNYSIVICDGVIVLNDLPERLYDELSNIEIIHKVAINDIN